MSRNFILKKTTPNDVVFTLSPISNTTMVKKYHLSKRNPQVALPEDWAMGVFFDAEVFNMFRKGLISFTDNDAARQAAVENGVYFDDKFDFTPAKDTDIVEIEKILKEGRRDPMIEAINRFGKNKVKEVAISIREQLTVNVIKFLEEALKIQLTLNEM